MQAWWAVYTGGEKLDLAPKEPVAMFKYKEHAKEFNNKWGEFGYVEPLHCYEDDFEAAWLESADPIWQEENEECDCTENCPCKE